MGCSHAEWGEYPSATLELHKNNYLVCLKQTLSADDEFLKVMDMAMSAAMTNSKNQHLEDIFNTRWMQSNLPKFDRLYVWSDMDGCLGWDWKKIIGQKDCMSLTDYHKCPQESRPGACFSREKWNCWREGEDHWSGDCKDQGYEGACKYSNHGKSIVDASEVRTCKEMGECANCKAGAWGACYVKDKSGVPAHKQCFCVQPNNGFLISKSLLKYGCDTKQILGLPKSYDGLCRLDGFYIPKPGEKMSKTKPKAVPNQNQLKLVKGQNLECKTRSGVWKACLVISTSPDGSRAKMRFVGFGARFDKYFSTSSPDLRLS